MLLKIWGLSNPPLHPHSIWILNHIVTCLVHSAMMVQKGWVVLARLSSIWCTIVLSVDLFSWSILTTLRVHRGGHTEDFIPLADQHPPRAMHHHTSSLTTTEDSDMHLKRLLKTRQDNNKEMWLIFSDAGDVFCQSLLESLVAKDPFLRY